MPAPSPDIPSRPITQRNYAGSRPAGVQKRGCLLTGEVVHPEEGAVDAEFLRGDRKINALQQGLARSSGL
ncbi:hypothetical protein [Pseudarthrobacter sp. TAF60_1]|uniref:hypothetical protein n=1 Tax=Pseudarthrobacter sp. TAF60_1 TaxID=3233071 RepID=UPI003F9A8B42